MQAAETPQAALCYLQRGYHPLPLHHPMEDGSCSCGATEEGHATGKHPRERGWQSQDAPSAADVYTLWGETYPEANVGLVTGEASGFWVLDVDPKHEGDVRLKELEAEHGDLPATYRVRTPSGGVHFYFALPEGFTVTNSPGRLPSGLDVRGNGGQVVAPPSTTEAGAYEVERASDVLPAPSWLLELIRPREPEKRDPAEVAVRASDEVARYVSAAVEAETARVDRATEDRNIALNRATFSLASIAAHEDSGLNLEELRETMEAAGLSTGLGVGEVRKTVASGIRGGLMKPREPWPPSHPHDALAFTYDEEEAFWNARPKLGIIRDAARAKRVSPWVALAGTLSTISYATPPNYVLPDTIGTEASLNLYVALVGASGATKDAGREVGARLIDVGEVPQEWGLGSGEGALSTFVEYRKGEGLVRIADRAIFYEGEVSMVAALSERSSSTIIPMLLKMWMGATASFAYKGKENRLRVEPHTYRSPLLIGVQPDRADAMFQGAGVGFPQRFGWMPAWDVNKPPRDELPEYPGRIGRWKPPEGTPDPLTGLVVMELPEVATEAILKAADEKLDNPKGGGLDGHALLAREKWAAHLALLEGRLVVNEEDWRLSGIIQKVSDATRAFCQAELDQKAQAANRSRGKLDAHRDHARESERAALVDEDVTKTIHLLQGYLAKDGELPEGQLKNRLPKGRRPLFEDAIRRLTEAGQVTPDERNGNTYYAPEGGTP